ncbi:O-antigen ligase family protein [Candidatus Tisiphia endosymbiont of Beris chalybata]|uniref:O-antigen ligase family protein n=1 Tax=Candidatus Tisiphia endosymbiont of Beris chalybata TaxID=3066262 RepID=UPI00312CAAD0
MSYQLISILVAIIPALGLVSGFSVAVTVPIFLLLTLYALQGKLFINLQPVAIKNNLLSKWKLELMFGLWSLVTIFFSPNSLGSLGIYIQISLIILIGFIVNSNIDTLAINHFTVSRYFVIGMLAAVSIFVIEYFSYGMITRGFRVIFQPKTSGHFFLFTLDRGCSLLSVFSWIVIGIFIQYRKYFLALIYYLLIVYLLSISDSLASFLAFIIGGGVLLSSRLLFLRSLQSVFLKLFTIALITGSICMPIISYKIAPYEAANHYANFLPDSAKHRLFIWNFVANKIVEKPIIGHGFSSSRYYSQYYHTNNNKIITYNQWSFSLFPLHPHNNIMQILFETGIIGFLLFLSLLVKYLKQIGNLVISSIDKDNFSQTNSKMLNYTSICYAAFINYYIIGMISFNIWQTWWVCTAFGAMILLQLLVRYSQSDLAGDT